MESKTQQFDKALAEYFAKLEPELDERGWQWRVCHFSGEKFYVRPEDIEFYKKIGVPLPALSPHERTRRKLAYNNLFNLFYIKSAFSGKNIIASYPPTYPYKIYERAIWNSDQWDPLDFGISYDHKDSFLRGTANFS